MHSSTGSILLVIISDLLATSSALTLQEVLDLHGKLLSERELKSLKRHLQGHHSSMSAIHELFENRNKIERNVEFTDSGLIATTTSTNEYVASLIQMHVKDMKNLEMPIRQGDPLFVSLFENIEQTNLQVQNIENGVNVTHSGTTDCGVILAQEHAAQVTSFVETGSRRPNFDWSEPRVCEDPQPLESSPTTLTPVITSPVTSPPTNPPTSFPTTLPPTSNLATTSPATSPTSDIATTLPTTPPPTNFDDETMKPTTSGAHAIEKVAFSCLLILWVLFNS